MSTLKTHIANAIAREPQDPHLLYDLIFVLSVIPLLLSFCTMGYEKYTGKRWRS